ncbi:putative hydrolase or acyltransferase of alpha/beta superfamily [Nostoc sp. PCC 7524]|uniref:alpha/beta fold hydrolase n=1 Tax=Nostoc sp. (strain ATCC 29411 / PCC 7524) TaxID=28072 RepID=UPI00029ED715|nr:alpha/beta hydrolase [Nostoc sp. PCC 7524]AFY49101.1 putative hydrolase or acyltransferase of alpha/beta superfamily [Nostoc sp. PCC 7524]
MSDAIDVVWISSSPVLQRFDKPLLQYLSQYVNVAQWEYRHGKDEGGSIDEAVDLLAEFLSQCPHPIDLGGHGAGGAIALTYARRYPEKVRSLILLAVASQPANTWHAHYYLQRQVFTMSREQVLASSVRHLFGEQPHNTTKKLIAVLDRDLEQTPLLHSLFKLVDLPTGGVSMPMLVCGSKNDTIVNPPALQNWLHCFKPEDHLWECPKGHHFFHYFYPQQVGEQMLNFWQLYYPQPRDTTVLFSSTLIN